jgi:hypothetical protein
MLYRGHPALLPHEDLQQAREAAGFLCAELFAVALHAPASPEDARPGRGVPQLCSLWGELSARGARHEQNLQAVRRTLEELAGQGAVVRVGGKSYPSAAEGVVERAVLARRKLANLHDLAGFVRGGKLSADEYRGPLARLWSVVGALDFQRLEVQLDAEFRQAAHRRAQRTPQTRQAAPGRRKPGRPPRNHELVEFVLAELSRQDKNRQRKLVEICNDFRKKNPNHPICKAQDFHGACKSALRKARKKAGAKPGAK